MKPKKLFHGSGVFVKGDYLITNRSRDNSSKENSQIGVYASERKEIAIGMALTNEKYTKSFADYHKKPFKIIFVRGKPKNKYVYLYTLSSAGFVESPKKSHQWISKDNVKILKREKLEVSKLNAFWRKATNKEKNYYYSLKN